MRMSKNESAQPLLDPTIAGEGHHCTAELQNSRFVALVSPEFQF